MKKIVVLASLLVSLSFGLNQMQNFYSVTLLPGIIAPMKKGGVGECKSVQDKVKGCYVHTKNKDGSTKQFVVYANKEIFVFYRVFKTEIPMPMETGMVVCQNKGSKGECTKITGNSMGIEDKKFTDDWQKLLKTYIK